MTSSIKLGWYSLIIYLVLSFISWGFADISTPIISSTILSISAIASILLWYEAIKLGMKKSVKDGIIISSFFIIPYLLILIITYKALFRDELKDAFKLMFWTIFSQPMRIVPEAVSHMKSITFFAFEPLGILCLLFLINLILKFAKNKKSF